MKMKGKFALTMTSERLMKFTNPPKIWVNIGLGNNLMPEGTKPLPESMLTYPQWGSVALTLDKFHKKFRWRYQIASWVGKVLIDDMAGIQHGHKL